MISVHHLISKSSSLCTNFLLTLQIALITIVITVTFMLHFFSSPARSRHLSLFLLSYSFTLMSAGMAKSTIRQVLFFYWLLLGLVVWPRLSNPFLFLNPKEFCASHFPAWVVHIPFVLWSNLNLHNFRWITAHPVVYQTIFEVPYCFRLFMELTVSFLSPHIRHLLFSCVFSILALS